MREELELTKAIKTRPSCSPRSSRSRARRPPRAAFRAEHARASGGRRARDLLRQRRRHHPLDQGSAEGAVREDRHYLYQAQLAVLHEAVNGDDPDSTSAGRLGNTSAAATDVFECVHAHVVQCCRGMHLSNFTQLQLLYANELEEIVAQSLDCAGDAATGYTAVQCCRGMNLLLKFAQLQLLYTKELEEIVVQSTIAQETALPAVPRCSATAA
ncbi:hypothetical protein PF007_g22736 [Phytophthora fragariae]|nr:hypothetical protein PF007_g22736 [Phytophthora fragariae]